MSDQHLVHSPEKARGCPHCFDALVERSRQANKLLLSIEGSILAYWTDIPQADLEEFRVRIREHLGDWEPTK